MFKKYKLLSVLLAFIIIISYGCSSDKDVKEAVFSPVVEEPLFHNLEINALNVNQNNVHVPYKPASAAPPKVIQGLVNLQQVDKDIVVDLKYSTADNFTGKVIYNFKTCLLREGTAAKLNHANQEFMKFGYRIKIFDGYRPPYAQKILWNKVPDERYVANPSKGGSIHSKGAAVDITLIDPNGRELEMPSKYDDMTARAGRNRSNITETAEKNLKFLTDIMISNGFTTISSEWWHYDDCDRVNYRQVDVNPLDFQ